MHASNPQFTFSFSVVVIVNSLKICVQKNRHKWKRCLSSLKDRTWHEFSGMRFSRNVEPGLKRVWEQLFSFSFLFFSSGRRICLYVFLFRIVTLLIPLLLLRLLALLSLSSLATWSEIHVKLYVPNASFTSYIHDFQDLSPTSCSLISIFMVLCMSYAIKTV